MNGAGEPDFYRYWGKADLTSAAPGCHLLAYHALDVAAVGVALLRARPSWAGAFARLAGADPQSLDRWVGFLLALHDLGKFGAGFQSLQPHWVEQLGGASPGRVNKPRHDTLGFLLWREFADERSDCPVLEARLPLADDAGEVRPGRSKRACLPLVGAVTGHHGRPPVGGLSSPAILPDHFATHRADGQWKAAASFVRATRDLLGPHEPLVCRGSIDEASFKPSSWWLAGFTTLCDWVGSNARWFPYTSERQTLDSYWVHAREQADRAIAEAGLTPRRSRCFGGLARLFPEIARPSPLQEAAATVELGEGPQLFLLEDLTGSGKTEAALTLVSRLLAAGRADGLYFALPTMATANAMYARVERIRGKLFEPEPPPAVVLAHSGPRLLPRPAGLGRDAIEEHRDGGYGEGDLSASLAARGWLSDHGKKALLAEIGVGTVDQALLGALQAKHNTLRLLGLHGHVLVVDEVHACDTYMNGLLKELLRMQAAFGGSVILLSATLPLATREQLVGAFREGLGAEGQVPQDPAYPLMLRADAAAVATMAVAPRAGSARRVGVSFFAEVEETVAWCVAEARAGRCVAWIRNTVKDAMGAFDALREQLGSELVQLFHARFPMGDRLSIEQDVVARFGRGGDSGGRRGRVVVATQVMEQSLDIDFDSLVTDLAPIDRLVQRAGRLQRHARGERPAPVLHVLAPEWTEAPVGDWPGAAFRGTSAVYPKPSTLWRTQRVLREEGGLELPHQARHLVESVFGEKGGEVPDALLLHDRELEATATELRDRGLSEHNQVRLSHGYLRTGAEWDEDEYVPTRLGEPTTTIRFVRGLGDSLLPWCASTELPESIRWRLGEVSVRADQLCEDHEQSESLRGTLRAMEAEPPEHVVPVAMTPAPAGGWVGRGVARTRGGNSIVPVEIRIESDRGIEFRRLREG